MSIKEQAIAMIRRLPEEADLKDIEEELALLSALQEAEADIQSGNLVSNDEMKKRLQQWSERLAPTQAITSTAFSALRK